MTTPQPAPEARERPSAESVALAKKLSAWVTRDHTMNGPKYIPREQWERECAEFLEPELAALRAQRGVPNREELAKVLYERHRIHPWSRYKLPSWEESTDDDKWVHRRLADAAIAHVFREAAEEVCEPFYLGYKAAKHFDCLKVLSLDPEAVEAFMSAYAAAVAAAKSGEQSDEATEEYVMSLEEKTVAARQEKRKVAEELAEAREQLADANKFIKVVGIKQVCGKPSAGATVRIAVSSIAAVVRFDPADISIMLNGGHVIDAAKNGNQAILDYASSKLSSSSTF